MKKSAINEASDNLVRATDSVQVMKNARKRPQFQAAWSDFLSAAQRVFSKLEHGSKNSPESKVWFGLKIHDRRTDPLLRYIHHARNADEHGLEQISTQVPGYKLGEIESVIYDTTPDMKLKPFPSMVLRPVEIVPSSAMLFPILDRGVLYTPPSEHLGTKIANPSPIEVAELAVAYLRNMLAEARKLP
jgi:hypothetical protein